MPSSWGWPESGAREARCDLLEHASHLPTMPSSYRQQAREIAARPSQARDETRTDRVGDTDEHDRDYAALPLQRGGDRRRMCEDHVGPQGNQLFRKRLMPICAAGRKPIVDADIAALRALISRQLNCECRFHAY